MKKNIVIYGLIAGAIVSILMLSTVNYLSHCEGNVNYDTSMLIGYASMLIAFSLVFVGIRNYRDKFNEGIISFGKAFKIGTMIVLIASTIYVIAWLIAVSYTHLRAHETVLDLVCRLLLEKKKTNIY